MAVALNLSFFGHSKASKIISKNTHTYKPISATIFNLTFGNWPALTEINIIQLPFLFRFSEFFGCCCCCCSTLNHQVSSVSESNNIMITAHDVNIIFIIFIRMALISVKCLANVLIFINSSFRYRFHLLSLAFSAFPVPQLRFF